jgi:60 kDa SS-A/Ro ribonucleoprotein
MSRFNTTLPKQKTLTNNLAGGQSYKQSIEMEFISLLLTSFVNEQFYRDATSTLDQLSSFSKKIKDKEFLAKAAIFARDKFGMRSITHALAAELTSELSGMDWSKDFYDKVVVRVDDMTEILSYYLENKTSKDNPKFPNSLKRGFAKAFDKFDSYQLSKYVGKNKSFKLVDVVNLVHPIPTEKNKEALESLIKGDLRNTQTWESKLSSVGQLAESKEDLSQLKSEAWFDLISNKKLGLMAMIKNLRNIITQSPQSVEMVCDSLTNEKFILNSRVLPFRFSTAYEEVSKIGSSKEIRAILSAISGAMDISCKNIPIFEDTLFVVDVSGSMSGRPSEIASLFAAMFAKSNNCDVITFATNSKYVNYNPDDSVMTIRNSFKFSGGGTNFKSIFTLANKSYKNIIIASDMQGWLDYTSPTVEFKNYKSKYNCNPDVFSLDLAGYGTLQFPESQVYCLAGFSDKIFQIMDLLKTDKNALLNEINSISWK